MDENRRASGVVLVIVSAVVFSTAGIFTKGVVTGSWGIIFWRGLAAAGFTVIYLALRGKLMHEIRVFRGLRCWWPCWGRRAPSPSFRPSS